MSAELKFIGEIETPYEQVSDCPSNIQVDGPECRVVLKPEYQQALMGLEAGRQILLLYWFEGTDRSLMQQRRRGQADQPLRGTFALRSPHRPNPIAVARVPIEKIKDGVITVLGLDCLNGTKLLDIKPALSREVGEP